MPKYLRIISLLLLFAGFFFLSHSDSALALSSSDTTIIHLQIENCNNNGICEPQFGENYQGCPLDCAAPTSTPTSTPPSGGGSGGGVAPQTGGGSSQNNNQNSPGAIDLRTITIVVTSHSAVISWQTYGDALSMLSWGRTVDGELGTISEINYGTTHNIVIDNLKPSTRYFFKIESRDRNGNIYYFGPQGFITNSETPAPENVRDFRADLFDSYIHLSWKNPTTRNFRSVRILRSESFYPDDPEQGNIMYEGRGESADDLAIKAGGDYYYSAFAEDESGNFSSGSLLHVRLRDGNNPLPSNIKSPGAKTVIVPLEFYIEQDRSQIPFTNNVAELKIGQPIRISVSPDSLPDNVRYFIINVEDENIPGTFHSYFLRHVNSVSVFETILPAFTKEGKFAFSVSLLNSKQEEVGRFEGAFEVKKDPISWFGRGFWQALMAWIIGFWVKLLQILRLY